MIYATDEDTTGGDPDPDSNRYDLGNDPLEFAKQRIQTVNELLPGLVERVTPEGDDYTQARRVFSILIGQRAQALSYVARYVGGLKTSRSHRGDKDAKPPITLVDAKVQRDALAVIEENVLADKAWAFPPELYNQFGWNHWSHWGMNPPGRKDYGVHDVILRFQESALRQLLSAPTLNRIHDAELKAAPEADLVTTAELIERLTKSVFSEVETIKEGEYTARKPAISSLRRNLQRSLLKTLSHLAIGTSGAPQDCQTVAWDQLSRLNQRMTALLQNNAVSSKLDAYTRAHLQESSSRIQKVLEAKLALPNP